MTKPERKKAEKYKGDIAAIKLRIVVVENLQKGEWVPAWFDLHDAYRQANHLAHIGSRHVAECLADLYEQGKEHRGKEKQGRISNDEAAALSKPMYRLMCLAAKKHKRGITTGHIGQLSHDLFKKEFSDGKDKKKLADIIHGKRGFPVPNHIGMPIRPADWWMQMEERTLPARMNKKGELQEPVVITCPVIYLTSLFSGGGRMRLVCAPLRGRGSNSTQKIVDAVVSVPKTDSKHKKTWVVYDNGDQGPKRGVVTLKRIKKPQDAYARWAAIVSYGLPKVETPEAVKCAVVVHRGVAHGLMMAVVKPDEIQFHWWYGHEVVDYKAQIRARKQRYQVDASAPRGNGRGRKHRYTKLRSLGDKEKRFTDTAMWGAAKRLQDITEKSGATIAILESMGTFRCDAKDDRDRAIPSYIRNWPYAALKLKCKDVLTRRLGLIDIREVSVNYISQKCPACGHTDEENIARLPRTNASEEWRGGTFRCVVCRFTRDLDEVAIMNMIARSDLPWAAAAVKTQIDKWKKWKKESESRAEKMLDTVLDQEHPDLRPINEDDEDNDE